MKITRKWTDKKLAEACRLAIKLANNPLLKEALYVAALLFENPHPPVKQKQKRKRKLSKSK